MDDHFRQVEEAAGSRADKPWKATLFQGEQMMLGVNVLEAGQEQAVHTHAGQDKFYLVQEGRGLFHVDGQEREQGAGAAVWAPAGAPHGVRNPGPGRLLLVVGMAPAP